ncbi:MAG: Co2+/Mg2+ efflux protein ApaG [Phycisphaerales bacterium]
MITPTPRIASSVTLTRGFRVSVSPGYLPDHSEPEAGRFVFGYRIRIRNESRARARLVSRRWLIVDAGGERQEIQGEGVVGQQPVLESGQTFVYTSYCPLPTTSGTMQGAFVMQADSGDFFEIEIGRFYLFGPAEHSRG